MSLMDILKQYANPTDTPPDAVAGHYDEVAREADHRELGGGIAAALRSDATPSLGETIGGLFERSNADQKAGVLNEILKVLGPSGIATAGGGILGRILANVSGAANATISPGQAAQVSPADLNAITTKAQQHDSTLIDRLGTFYAQHPMLVKTLGAAAMGMVMSHMSDQRRG